MVPTARLRELAVQILAEAGQADAGDGCRLLAQIVASDLLWRMPAGH